VLLIEYDMLLHQLKTIQVPQCQDGTQQSKNNEVEDYYQDSGLNRKKQIEIVQEKIKFFKSIKHGRFETKHYTGMQDTGLNAK
jgi:hypothetical protein